jgi:hypothetical protein
MDADKIDLKVQSSFAVFIIKKQNYPVRLESDRNIRPALQFLLGFYFNFVYYNCKNLPNKKCLKKLKRQSNYV